MDGDQIRAPNILLERSLYHLVKKTIMKNLIAIALILLGSSILSAQAYPPLGAARELKFNAGLLLATGTAEGSYEYYLGEDISVGGTAYWDNDAYDSNGNFGIGPNLRAYFGYAPRSGFFAEAFGLYYTGKEDLISNPERRETTFNTFALGLGGGNKWTTRSGRLSLEIFGGIGRNLNPEAFQNTFMYRAGLNIGFRF